LRRSLRFLEVPIMQRFSIWENGAKLKTCRAVIYLTVTEELLVVFCFQYFTTAIKTVRADMVTHMRFTSSWLDSQLRSNQEIVRTMHAALGWGLLILLNSHDNS
jgi:hypothetical protein